ncbi:alpha-galactosidase [Bifidobacterium sp. 82T24]|uniref:glycoside hydrolase family 36 protein n=1 Tax=Bifidobacterium pluvialisilvae TaxID=2834436 RepID=UPI001C5A34C1|nr:glycoside hydrolase family 36 protein [Bifidobacterium pluvialisilvae]MBW3087518.1 alpha-galactosidase [Bifidobacterium pluvialisilvae]
MTEQFTWGNDRIQVTFTYADDQPLSLTAIRAADGDYTDPEPFPYPQSFVEITADGFMQGNMGSRYSETMIGNDLRYVDRHEEHVDGASKLHIALHSAKYGLDAEAVLTAPNDAAAISSTVRVTNTGDGPITLTSVSSLSAYVRLGDNDPDHWDLYTAKSDWAAENRWSHEPIRDNQLVKSLGLKSASILSIGNPTASCIEIGGTVTHQSTTSRSTGSEEPTGAIVDRTSGTAIVWQAANNGPWLWQLGERPDGVYLDVYGPTDIEHHWSIPLAPGESFVTIPATVAVSGKGFDGAIAEMTRYRRYDVLDHPDHTNLPVIFNDYMNTLSGDPTTERELPLIDAAAKAGAEYYCVDCGWYDDGGDWWPSVGEWHESKRRFPNGFKEVLDHIRERGMKPGVWLEPEVIGVNSPMATKLPDSAFFQRDGKRIVTHMRYLLDIRDTAARAHLDATVDHLVDDLGVRFFKFDYNVNTGAGTDCDAPSRGEGQLEAGRAYLAWIDDLHARHPDLTIETCSSGAMRSDWATLAHSQIQSTSDQTDYIQYANIAASAPAIMLPEQAGNWAYPNKFMTPAQTRYAMLAGIVGRLYLSGYLTQMDDSQLQLVTKALDVHKTIRHDVAHSTPFWPIGLPKWNDDVLALGLRVDGGDHGYLAVWKKTPATDSPLTLHLGGHDAGFSGITQLFGSDSAATWTPDNATLTIDDRSSDDPFCALYRITY